MNKTEEDINHGLTRMDADNKKLPEGWEYIKIGEAFIVERGGSPRPIKKYLTDSTDGLNWIKISDATASNKYIYKTKQKITKDGLHKTRFVNKGDFILSNSMSFGRPYIMKTTGCIHDGWLVLRKKTKYTINQEYLYYILFSPNIFYQFDRIAAGSTVRNLNINLVSSVQIPLPPLAKQERIVAILDEAIAAIDKAKANAEKNLADAKELFESYLNEIFANPGEDWEEKKLGEVCEKIQDGAHASPKKLYSNKGENRFLYITSKNIRNNYMDLSNVSYCDKNFHNSIYPRCNPEIGDLLLTKDGANTGKITQNTINEQFSLLSSVCLIKTRRDILIPEYVKYFIQSSVGFRQITGKMTGAAIKRIILKTIKDATINMPFIAKQEQIVSKLDKLSAETKKLESIYQQKITALDELKKSILKKAFEGEL